MVTQTTPSRANAAPSYPPTDPDPFMNEPPWIQTSTGSPPAPASGVHTLRFRQSSPVITSSGNIGWYCGGDTAHRTYSPSEAAVSYTSLTLTEHSARATIHL